MAGIDEALGDRETARVRALLDMGEGSEEGTQGRGHRGIGEVGRCTEAGHGIDGKLVLHPPAAKIAQWCEQKFGQFDQAEGPAAAPQPFRQRRVGGRGAAPDCARRGAGGRRRRCRVS